MMTATTVNQGPRPWKLMSPYRVGAGGVRFTLLESYETQEEAIAAQEQENRLVVEALLRGGHGEGSEAIASDKWHKAVVEFDDSEYGDLRMVASDGQVVEERMSTTPVWLAGDRARMWSQEKDVSVEYTLTLRSNGRVIARGFTRKEWTGRPLTREWVSVKSDRSSR